MKLVKYLVWKGVFLTSMYCGLILDINGAQNITLFMAWGVIFVSLCLLIEDVRTDESIKLLLRAPSVPIYIDVLLKSSIILVFVYYGWIITGIGYTIHVSLIHFAREEVKSST